MILLLLLLLLSTNSVPAQHLSYNCTQLLNIMSNPYPIQRQFKKDLFELQLWGQHHGCTKVHCRPPPPADTPKAVNIQVSLDRPSHHFITSSIDHLNLTPILPHSALTIHNPPQHYPTSAIPDHLPAISEPEIKQVPIHIGLLAPSWCE